MKILGGVLFGLCLLVATAMLHRGQPLGWDELEFFRATRWVAEGQVPFRDFWEHHTPLQWLVFAPVAWFADGPGASSVVLLRWVQAMLWVGTFALLLRIAKAAGISASARWLAMTLLLAAPAFLRHALEYRVDALGSFLFVAAIAWALARPRW
jgi:dolichyl-phosphate-mannose--protein O-mannosyl transferase